MKRHVVLVTGLAAASVMAFSAVTPTGAGPSARPRRAAEAAASPATWTPWLLSGADQFRLGPPPARKSKSTRNDLRYLRRLQDRRTKKIERSINRWNDGAVSLRWTQIALDMIQKYKQRPPFASRLLGLLHTAMNDALIAAYDSREAYFRKSPWKVDGRIDAVLKPSGSSYPPKEAVLAGAAESMLTYLFPQESPSTFEAYADKATMTRLWAGANYRSDVNRGRALGNEVAEVFITYGEVDGYKNTDVSNPRPEGEEYWETTPPAFEPNLGGPVGTWVPWTMTEPSEARTGSEIEPPHAYGSDLFLQETQELVDGQANLTDDEAQIAQFWDDGPGTYTPPGHWHAIAKDLVVDYDLGTDDAVRLFAVLAAALHDASIASFEAKYAWWSIRPVTVIRRLCDDGSRLCTTSELEADPALATYPDWLSYLLTPPFPSYPGGHSTFSGAAGGVLTYFFPGSEGILNFQADQAAVSRFYGGIHFTSDNDAGLVLGRWIADRAVSLPQAGP